MKKTFWLVAGSAALLVAAACSSSVTINGTCGPLSFDIAASPVLIAGDCALGPAGIFQFNADAGGLGGPITANATFLQNGNALYATFAGTSTQNTTNANLLDVHGLFTFTGGTGTYSGATGSATADGGVDISVILSPTAELVLVGSVSY